MECLRGVFSRKRPLEVAPPAVTSETPAVPARYVPGELLGEGGAARVIRALDRESGSLVALKLPREETEPGGWEDNHLRREGEVASRLRHLAVVRLVDCGEHRGRPYVAFEFLPGGSLAAALRVGRMGLPELHRILTQIADGLGELHGRGWVHADMTPGNVLFDREGEPRLTDLGLARRIGEPAVEDGQVVASRSYAPPEQIAGRPLTPAADVYALCASLHVALTGQHPDLLPEAPELRGTALTSGLRGTHVALPERFGRLLLRGLAPEPSDRFSDGRELARALRAVSLRGLPVLRARAPESRAWRDAETAAEGRQVTGVRAAA